MNRDEALKLTPAEWRDYVQRTTRVRIAKQKADTAALTALEQAMIGPTSGGTARQLAPVILAAIKAGQIPGVRADQ
jgi:hypothetical protein